jgi:hypothetical protein
MGRTASETEALTAVFAGLEVQRRQVLRSFGCTMLAMPILVPLAFAPVLLMVWIGIGHPPGSTGAMLHDQFPAFMKANQAWAPFALGGWLIAGIVGTIWTLRRNALIPRWRYLAEYKRRVFTAVCRERFPGIAYEPDEGIPWKTFDGSGLFAHTCDVYQSEDRFTGRWGDTDVCFAEAWAKRERKRWTGKRRATEYEEYFRGIVFIADFHKHFHSTTRLIPTGEKASFAPGEERTKLEDPAFEALFDVYTTDPTDVRYVLSSSMMARLVALSGRFHRVRARLHDERLMLLLPSHRRQQFEPSLTRRASSRVQIEGFVQDVEACLAVVEALSLDTRIWSKAPEG